MASPIFLGDNREPHPVHCLSTRVKRAGDFHGCERTVDARGAIAHGM